MTKKNEAVAMEPNAEEVGRGYVRPFRLFVKHNPCAIIGRLGRQPASDLARDPKSPPVLYCSGCRGQYDTSEFVWMNPRLDGKLDHAGEETPFVVGT